MAYSGHTLYLSKNTMSINCINSCSISFHQNELKSISLPIGYLSLQQASEGSQGCCDVIGPCPSSFKSVVQTGLPLLPEENKTIKDGDGLTWRTDCRKFYLQLRCERAAKLTLNPPWPCVTVGLQSHCEARRDVVRHTATAHPRGSRLMLGKDSWRTLWQRGQGKWGEGKSGKMAAKGTQGQTGSGHSRLVSC